MNTDQRSHHSQKTALVVGANGVIGRNLIEYLATLPDWNIVGVSRRGGESTKRISYLSADLLDREDTVAKLSHLSEVTHIFYAAYQDRPAGRARCPESGNARSCCGSY